MSQTSPRPSPGEILRPQILVEIENYQLLARTAVEGYLAGAHRSLHRGAGSEFLQYRNYVPGDDPKYVDWQLYARINRLHTKVFQEETNMNCCIVLDASASMAYQGERAACSKLRYASMLAACMAYLAVRQTDNLGFYAFNDGLAAALPPRRRTGTLARVCGELGALRAGGGGDAASVTGTVADSLRERGVVVLLSDFLGGSEALRAQLRRVRSRRHECLVFQVLDPDELDLPFARTTRFVDSETGERLLTYPETFRDDYERSMTDHMRAVREACLQARTDCQQVTTDSPLGASLAAYLRRRGSCGPW